MAVLPPSVLKPFSIQVSYDTSNDDGKQFRARAVFQTEACCARFAYALAEEAFAGRDAKLGAILPGRHLVIP